MPGYTACLCIPLKSTSLADWLISLKTKPGLHPPTRQGLHLQGSPAPAHCAKGRHTKTQGFVLGAAARPGLPARLWSAPSRKLRGLAPGCLKPSFPSPQPSIKVQDGAAVALRLSRPRVLLRPGSAQLNRPSRTARTSLPRSGPAVRGCTLGARRVWGHLVMLARTGHDLTWREAL